jgi:hypothetical protein
MPELAALLWIKLPGESDGICGGETTYLFSSRQARRLTVTGIASWRTPQPVSTGRERWSARDPVRGREGQKPGHRDHDQLEEEPTLRTQVESVEEVP